MPSSKKKDPSASVQGSDLHSQSEGSAKILALEEEVRHLRQVLGTHTVKEYLADLREESWRERTNPAIAKEVEKRLAKKR